MHIVARFHCIYKVRKVPIFVTETLFLASRLIGTKKIHIYPFQFFFWFLIEFRGPFEKDKRGPNEPKVTLFTIGTAFLASRLNVTINEINLMFDKKYI